MEYKIRFGIDTGDIVSDFHAAMDKFRDNIEREIPQRQLQDMNIVYTDDADGYEYSIPYYDFINTLDNQILVVLENIERIETEKKEIETITI